MRLLTTLTLLLLATAAAGETTAEEAFRRARGWTVQIRTSVHQAFAEDEQGSFMGAGLVVDAGRGWVLTNAHVASHSYGQIALAFEDGRALPAERVYVDPYLDLAIIAYDPKRLARRPAEPELECTGIPAVGHLVGAFGHPWGFRFTGTRGIASAVTSRLGPEMLQTDAPINEGNSGGPLMSLESGRVVGINSATMRKSDAEGLSFAVPARFACTILELLQAGRDPSPPAPLVDFAVSADEEQTLLVARSRLPKDAIDLRTGDEVLSAGTRSLSTATELIDALRGHLDQASLTVRRNGVVTVLTGRWPAEPLITRREGLWIAGALFADAASFTAGQIAGSPALMVHHVEPGSEAEAVGLQKDDLVTAASGQGVNSVAELEAAARRAASARRPLELMLLRLTDEDQNVLFQYQHRHLEVSDLARVGPPGPPAPRSPGGQ
ncbi:MAG TPA: trypsin-like peptidase domain-containing protein [Steroidobacteraceae bacterium]|nr:trypsin-like peptidase domain-containing protein [Steroidobacteraceae bacterium]